MDNYDHIIARHHPLIAQLQLRLQRAELKGVGYLWVKPEDIEDPTMPSGFYRAFPEGRIDNPLVVAVPREDIFDVVEHTGVWAQGGLKLYLSVMVY